MKIRTRRNDSGKQQYRVQFEKEALPYLDAVYNFAISLTRNRVVAEDLTQETFLLAFRGFRKFQIGSREGGNRPDPWRNRGSPPRG